MHWNASEWRKDPDPGRRKRVARPKEERISHVDESLRIISDDLWKRVLRRVRPAKNETRLKTGGKPKYLLSGLLRCDVCDAHYTITNATSYGCSSYHDGSGHHYNVRAVGTLTAHSGDREAEKVTGVRPVPRQAPPAPTMPPPRPTQNFNAFYTDQDAEWHRAVAQMTARRNNSLVLTLTQYPRS